MLQQLIRCGNDHLVFQFIVLHFSHYIRLSLRLSQHIASFQPQISSLDLLDYVNSYYLFVTYHIALWLLIFFYVYIFFSSIDGKLYLRTRLSLMLLSVPYNTSIVHWAWQMDGGRERKREREIKKCKKISFAQIIYIQIWHHRKQQLPVRSVICQ